MIQSSIRHHAGGESIAPASGCEDDDRAGPRPDLRASLAVLLLFVVLGIGHTWPLASAPNSLSRHDNGDAILNEWTLAWVAHQLPRDPLHLFDANIFYPERNALAFSEHLFVQAMMGAPLLWAGVPTLVVFNLVTIAGFVLTGWTMALVMFRYTRDWMPAVLAGALLAFNAHTLSRLAHLQASHVEFLPLAMLALDRLLNQPRVGHALRLAGAFALQSLTSNYFLVFMTFGMTAAGAVRVRECLGRGRARVFGLLLVAAAAAVLLLLPFLIPYYQANRDQGLTRQWAEVAFYDGSWQDYLAASGRMHYAAWSARFWRRHGAALFPGVAALALAAVAIGSGLAWRSRFARMWLALGVVGVVLSFGTSLPGYAVLYRAVPLLQGIRASVRFGYLGLAAIAVLAGFGLAYLRRRTGDRPRVRLAIGVAAIVIATVEAARLPLGFEPPHRTPRLYELLAAEPDAVIVELPLYSRGEFFRNAPYMLHATAHWKPILNGYSGFLPASYIRHYAELHVFPDSSALAYLRSLRVTHVVVHADSFAEVGGLERFERIERTPGLRLALRSGIVSVYRLDPDPR